MPRLVSVAYALLALCGCTSKPIYHGPNYTLQDVPAGAVASNLDLKVVDGRPDWERRYYEGTVTCVPLENLRPSPFGYLSDAIKLEIDKLPGPPCQVELTVNSFRVVFSEEEKKKEAERRKNESDEGLQVEDDDSVAGMMVSTFLIGPLLEIGKLGLAGCYEQIREGVSEWGPKERHLKGPPRQMKEHYCDGRTCDIRATALLEWPDGRMRTLNLRGLNTSDEINPAVVAACNLVAQELNQMIRNPNTSLQKDASRQPAYTAYGGN